MPKSKNSRNSDETDIKLADYANASLPSSESSRISKKAANASAKSLRETKNWWELDADDLNPLNDTCEDDDDDDESVADFTSSSTCSKSPSQKADQTFCIYPVDLFFLIASYIKPEDVCRFALISKGAYFVTHSAGFWKNMYKRFYKFSVDLPEHLRPTDIDRLYGLRTCVVKSLFHMYPSFMDRTKRPNGVVSLGGECIKKLCRSVCESAWVEKIEARSPIGPRVWHYYFKFSLICNKRDILTPSSMRNPIQRCAIKLPKRLRMLDNIYANLEDNCCILKVVCAHFTNVPTVLGWRLSEFSVSLNSDMRSHRVKLTFESGSSLKLRGKQNSSQPSSGPKEVAVLDGVQSLVLLDWWHPNYPLPVV